MTFASCLRWTRRLAKVSFWCEAGNERILIASSGCGSSRTVAVETTYATRTAWSADRKPEVHVVVVPSHASELPASLSQFARPLQQAREPLYPDPDIFVLLSLQFWHHRKWVGGRARKRVLGNSATCQAGSTGVALGGASSA
jgi:hypothetical protein